MLHSPPTSSSISAAEHTPCRSSARSSLHPAAATAAISSPLGPNTFLSAPLSKTLSLCSSLDVTYQVSHPYKPTWNITVCTLYIFRRHNGRHNILHRTEDGVLSSICFWFLRARNFEVLVSFPNISVAPKCQRLSQMLVSFSNVNVFPKY